MVEVGIAAQVAAAQRDYLEAKAHTAELCRKRDELVVVAHDLHGLSYRELALALGMKGKGGVHRIFLDSERFRLPSA